MSGRVYVPSTLAGLAELADAGTLPASVPRLMAADESEEAEYAALMEAAAESAALPDQAGRRVVIVAELPDPDGPVPLDRVVAVHVDTDDDADEDDDLAWFASQEIPHLLR